MGSEMCIRDRPSLPQSEKNRKKNVCRLNRSSSIGVCIVIPRPTLSKPLTTDWLSTSVATCARRSNPGLRTQPSFNTAHPANASIALMCLLTHSGGNRTCLEISSVGTDEATHATAEASITALVMCSAKCCARYQGSSCAIGAMSRPRSSSSLSPLLGAIVTVEFQRCSRGPCALFIASNI